MEIQIAYCFRLISGTFNCHRTVRMIVADHQRRHIPEYGAELWKKPMKNLISENNNRKWPERPAEFPQLMTPAVLPDGNGGFTPCPELLTEEEAIRFLRLDGIDIEDPANTLRYYRKKGLLRATQVGKCIRYRRIELEKFLERLTETNPR
jgi:hypothetical protein